MQLADMYSTAQFGQIGWPPSCAVMPCSDKASSNHLPISLADPRGTPFLAFVQDLYDSQGIYYGMSFNKQSHDANSCASHKYAEGLSEANLNTNFYPVQPHSLLKPDGSTVPVQTEGPGRPPAHLLHQTSVDFKEEMLRNRHIDSNENTFMEWMYPPEKGPPSRSFAEDTVQWGSDAMFDTTESRATRRRVGVRQLTQFGLQLMPEDEEEEEEEEEEEQDGEEEDARSTGGRSSQARSPAASVRKGPGGRSKGNIPKKAYTERAVAPVAGPLMSRREPKGQRKKLTIEQKRSNHIRHEKKRRGLIRNGFNDLTELVPELRGGTWSRSRILFKAVEFLTTLLERNETLQEQLDALNGGDGGK